MNTLKPSVRNSPEFDEFTRSFFSLPGHIQLEEWEASCVETPNIRRSSAELSERIFLHLLDRLQTPILMEVGGNIGRHSKVFLRHAISSLHTFEPNSLLFENFLEIEQSDRFRFNPFGLSATNGVTQFNIIEEVKGIRKGATHGMGSFEDVGPNYEKIYGGVKTKSIAAAHVRGDAYLDAIGYNGDMPLALWIDVEGHAPQVLDGFGDRLEQVKLLIVELETDNRYIPEPSVDYSMKILRRYGLVPVWRDIQYYGRFNLIFVQSEILSSMSEIVEDEARKFKEGVLKITKEKLFGEPQGRKIGHKS